MEEADQLLLLGVRDALGDAWPAHVTSAREVDGDVLCAAAAECVRLAAPEEPPPPARLPQDVGGRFRVGTELAARVKRLGYRAELGFHQLLYPNEKDTRRLLAFLLDKVPKAAPAPVASRPAGRGAVVAAALRAWAKPEAQRVDGQAPFWTAPLQPTEVERFATSQPQPGERLAPSLLHSCALSALRAAPPPDEDAEALPTSLDGAAGWAALRAALASSLAQQAAAPHDQQRARPAQPAAAEATAPPPIAPTAAPAVTPAAPESRLERLQSELAAAQEALAAAAAAAEAAQARAAECDAQAAAATAAAEEASRSTPQPEAEYVLRKRAASLLAVRISVCLCVCAHTLI